VTYTRVSTIPKKWKKTTKKLCDGTKFDISQGSGRNHEVKEVEGLYDYFVMEREANAYH
jgi:hypothetical protein